MKMEDQVHLTSEDLIRDYSYVTRQSLVDLTYKSRFYEI